ncbi:uncharacterized protein V1518DRAFT_443764 [Limtongia smithiae]|uniref:uncharacterized protein n=1 Tax=Limtongia smithiae TaxID=1125753 RepID=UPI0034CD18C2
MSSSPGPTPVTIPQDQSSLDDQLAELHAHPQNSYADVLFVMPNLPASQPSQHNTIPLPSLLWAHSALLAVTYAKPLSRLGESFLSVDEDGISSDGGSSEILRARLGLEPRTPHGLPYTAIVVPPEHDLAIRKLVASCYRPVVLRSLWERMGGKREMLTAFDVSMQYARSNNGGGIWPSAAAASEFDAADAGDEEEDLTNTSSMSIFSSLSIQDSTFQGDMTLRIEGERISFTVHKFLLDLRVPYFSTLFRSAFADASLSEHTLSSDYFTPLSLAIVVQYIYLDDADLLFSWKWTDFTRYVNSMKCTNDINPPTQDILDVFCDALVSAKFLQFESLEWWITNCLIKIAHGFACNGAQCARILPGIAILGQQYNMPQLYQPFISWMSKHSNILCLWKRNMLALPPELRLQLVEEVKAQVTLSNAIPLYLRLYSLRQNTLTSAFREDWEENILSPLIGFCGTYVSRHFAEPRVVFSAATAARNMLYKNPSISSYSAIEDLFQLVMTKMCKDNATLMWRGADCYAKLIPGMSEVETLSAKVTSWFVQHWEELVVPANSTTVGSTIKQHKRQSDTFIGFNEWQDDSLQKLSAQIGVPVAHLKGLSEAERNWEHRKEKWLEKCRVDEANRLRRRELLRTREEEKKVK